MTDLFNRTCSVTITSGVIVTTIEGLRFVFDVEKTPKKTMNQLSLEVYNLSTETRKKVSLFGAYIELVAGYDEPELIFSGDVLQVSHRKSGPDWVTSFKSTDGLLKKQSSRVSKSFAPGTKVSDAIKTMAEATGFNLGNVVTEIKKGNLKKGLEEFVNGFTAVGSATDELEKLMASYGYDVSVQDGTLQATASGGVVGIDIVLLSPETGLVESPEVAEDGTVTVKALIQQRFVPGRALRLVSAEFDGVYKIASTRYKGDTHGNDWCAEMVLETL